MVRGFKLYGTVLYGTVRYCTVGTVQYGTVLYCTVLYKSVTDRRKMVTDLLKTLYSITSDWILSTLKDIYFYMTSEYQVPPASVPLAEPCKADDPHLLGLDPGLPGHSGAVLQCRQSGGQEVDGDEAGEY